MGVFLALNEESCYLLMVFILRFNLKSLQTQRGRFPVVGLPANSKQEEL